MKRHLATLTAASTLVLSVGVASAETVDFSNENIFSTGNYPSLTTTIDGVGVRITAGTYQGGGSADPPDDTILFDDCSVTYDCDRFLNVESRGIGVQAPPFFGFIPENNETDGKSGDEIITFTFDRRVTMVSVLFDALDSNDDFDLFVDGLIVEEGINILAENPALIGLRGTSFSFGADDPNSFWDSRDDFLVAGMTAVVPLPAAGWMLLAGVGGLVAMKRRKKANA